MITSIRNLLAGFFAMLALGGCGPAAERGPLVLAAASLTEAMEEVADSWEAQGHARPVLSFAGTPSLARQIEGGAPADIFFSADQQWMDWLEERALVDPATRRVVVGNQLVLVSAKPWPAQRSIAEVLADLGASKLAMADPDSVPAGRYARATLENLGLWDAVSDKIVPAENVRAALVLVERGEVDWGIVYSSDASGAGHQLASQSFDFRDTPEIFYPAAMLTASQHAQASEFLEFLHSETAWAIFIRHGFHIFERADNAE